MKDTRDALTGLLTRDAFLEQVDVVTRQQQNLVLVMMDLDHFLEFNETHGHQAGDEWIRAITSRFADVFSGEGCLTGRYGGDEFMAVVPERDLFTIYQRAEALRASLESDPPQITSGGRTFAPGGSVSMGLADFPSSAADIHELIEKGKHALRRAKTTGGNRVTFYQENDALTGLLNHYASQQALEEAMKNSRPKNEPLSVFLLDIDRFKEINDEYGHRAGDEVLKRLGHILEANFKNLGHIGRTGGDEFLVILPGQPADSAFILADEVRRLVEDSDIAVQLGGRSYSLRFHISGGIATFPADGAERVDLLRKADEALYRSKQIGRNRISLPAQAQMVTKTSYYTQIQLQRLSELARRQDRTEAFLLREALDDLLRKYDEEGK